MADSRRKKRRSIFFGVPVVGFFRQSLVRGQASVEELQPILPIINLDEDLEEPNSNDDTNNNNKSQPQQSRSKELWSKLQNHVQHETFHIADLRDEQEKKKTIKNLNELTLPYEFSMLNCCIAMAIYLLIAVVAFSWLFEDWPVADSMYFAVVTFTTIGYGDVTPSTNQGKLFCMVFSLAGVTVLAIALGVVGSKIVEAQVSAVQATKDELVHDVLKLFSTKPIERSYSSLSNDRFQYLTDLDDPHHHDELLEPTAWTKCREFCTTLMQLLCRYGPALTPLFLGAFWIGHNEGWNWIDAAYYCIVTTTTIGYGDFAPSSAYMKLFAVVFIPLSVGAMGHFLGTIANFIVEQRRKAYDKQLWKHELTLEDLQSMSSTHNGVCTELDFVIFMLHAMKKVDKDLINHIRAHFRALDLTNSGTLSREDLELMAKKKLRSSRSKLALALYRKRLTSSFSEDSA